MEQRTARPPIWKVEFSHVPLPSSWQVVLGKGNNGRSDQNCGEEQHQKHGEVCASRLSHLNSLPLGDFCLVPHLCDWDPGLSAQLPNPRQCLTLVTQAQGNPLERLEDSGEPLSQQQTFSSDSKNGRFMLCHRWVLRPRPCPVAHPTCTGVPRTHQDPG